MKNILDVPRTKEQARRYYDRLSGIYDYLSGPFERKYSRKALEYLDIRSGESVLEIGFGTGCFIKEIAESVGKTGKAYGVDISSGMLEITRKRLDRAGLSDRVELYQGDALELPYESDMFDAVFMSFTLDLFDTPEIPVLLEEIKRVLKSGGRLGITCMSREEGESLPLRIYEALHKKWPVYVDCRPVYPTKSLEDAGYRILNKETGHLFGLPIAMISASAAG